MKMMKILAVVLFACSLQACNKSDAAAKRAMVVKDCTGTYLRMDEKDYLVCNEERLTNFQQGTIVKAIFTKADRCDLNGVICQMVHEHHGMIELHSVR